MLFFLIFFIGDVNSEIYKVDLMVLFNGDEVWEKYKNLYDDINVSSSYDVIERLDDKVFDLSYELHKKYPEDEGVIDNVIILLQDEIRIAYSRLKRNHRKYAQPDYFHELKFLNERIVIENQLVSMLLDAGCDDDWVHATLYKGLEVTVELIKVKLDLMAHQMKGDNVKPSDDVNNFILGVNSNLNVALGLIEKIK